MTASETFAARFLDLAIAPADPAERERWFSDVLDWRSQARESIEQNRERYDVAESTWASSAFVCGLVMLWDQAFYDPVADRFLVDEFLDDADSRFGGYDALILWHAYPRIGFDERNQFDFYREIPGGLTALAEIIDRLHARGVRAILDYNPWDTSTRAEGVQDHVALADLFAQTGADGLFLDTLPNAGAELLDELDRVATGIVLQSELEVPLDRVTDHLISWVQWPEHLESRLLLRNGWFEPRQMQNIVRRWHRSHADELHIAWLNGTGVVFWENVFGSWYPWSVDDTELLAAMHPIQKAAARFFSDGEWEPYVPTSSSEAAASRWDLAGSTLWTISNRSAHSVRESACFTSDLASFNVVDVLTGEWLDPLDPSVTVRPGSIGCVLAFEDPASPLVASVLSAPPPARETRVSEAVSPMDSLVRIPPEPLPPRELPAGMVAIAPCRTRIESIFLGRECGTYRRAEPENLSAPDFGRDVVEVFEGTIAPIAVSAAPVTNAEFWEFLRDSKYRPNDDRAFLRHWIDGAPHPASLDDPVTWVDLGDGRAYAAWRGLRLPTEHEWQLALNDERVGFGRRRVWEWTESEHSDGHTRFVMLKGGSDGVAGESSWYAERGPVTAERTAKFLLFYPGLDRCSTIGFRCAAPLEAVEA